MRESGILCRLIQRTTGSFLHTLGLEMFITHTEDEYIRAAILAVTDYTHELAQIRASLRHRLLTSPIIAGYPQAVDAAYRSLWRTWCAAQTRTHHDTEAA